MARLSIAMKKTFSNTPDLSKELFVRAFSRAKSPLNHFYTWCNMLLTGLHHSPVVVSITLHLLPLLLSLMFTRVGDNYHHHDEKSSRLQWKTEQKSLVLPSGFPSVPVPGIELCQGLGRNPLQHFLGEDAEQLPADVQGLKHRPGETFFLFHTNIKIINILNISY